MSRAPRRLPAALALLSGIAMVLSACAGASVPALTDPAEIITAGLKSTENARSVRIDLAVEGSINANLSGTDGPTASLPLTGTTAAADVDMASGKAHLTFAVPAVFNLSGDVIQIGETSYVKTSLGGPLYEAYQAVDSLPVDPTDAAGIFDSVGEVLLADGMDPVKGDDVDCGGKQCYTVLIDLTADELIALGVGQLAPADLPVDLGAASLAVTIRVEKDTYRLAGIRTVVSLGDQGSLTLDFTMSRWDEPMDISPPPADQVKPAG